MLIVDLKKIVDIFVYPSVSSELALVHLTLYHYFNFEQINIVLPKRQGVTGWSQQNWVSFPWSVRNLGFCLSLGSSSRVTCRWKTVSLVSWSKYSTILQVPRCLKNQPLVQNLYQGLEHLVLTRSTAPNFVSSKADFSNAYQIYASQTNAQRIRILRWSTLSPLYAVSQNSNADASLFVNASADVGYM